ncbi:MAG: nitroreductase family protein [Planctomycetes bacterium]|nr:nitroreductase family protein [Planctomycetota bacterium]
MKILDAIRARRSVRVFRAAPIPEDALLRILEAARIAPSARNIQEWKFIVVRDAETKRRLVPACANQAFVADAPIVIAGCATVTDYVMRCGQPAHAIDLAIAIDHMTIQAAAEGIGTCWIGAFYEDQVRGVLGVPEQVRIVQLLCLGVPDEPLDPDQPKKRKALSEIILEERWR